ncbi:MAG: bifunctional methyltransferase/pyrophosphohydrolase YabN [Desulfitobacteriaceae bacterium]
MGARLHIIGLGPAGLDKLTLGSYRKILQAEKVFVRTLEHPCVQDLMAEGVQFISFDEVYAQEGSFEKVYERIVSILQEELSRATEVFYAVPGHPFVAEKTVRLLREKLLFDIEMIIYPAVSFLDELFTALALDPVEGLLIKDNDSLRDSGMTGKEWLVVPQVFSQRIASEVKLDLMQVYPDEAKVFVVRGLGTEDQQVFDISLYELDHQVFDHLTTVVVPPTEDVASLTKLADIMTRLRSPEGCPWDREQTHVSLKPYLIEESYEVLEAIETRDMYNLCEELGDLLLQVVFHAQVAAEAGEFALTDVLRTIIEKLIRRHPHVFRTGKARTSDEVIQTWERIKQEEKVGQAKKTEYFSGPEGLPALMLAASTQRQAAKIGFDWPDWEGPWQKVQEELDELNRAIALGEGIGEELGDLLFAIVNVARFLKIDAEEALRDTIHKFRSRFYKMLDFAAVERKDLASLSLEEMDLYWDKAKCQEKSGKITID